MFDFYKKKSITPINVCEENKQPIYNKCILSTRIINLIGNKVNVENASKDKLGLLLSLGYSVRKTSIQPTILSLEQSNNMPEWRKKLAEELKSGHDVIINEIGLVECEALTDFVRSVRALSSFTHPYLFYVDPKMKSIEDIEDCVYKNYNQINAVYSINKNIEERREFIKIYLI